MANHPVGTILENHKGEYGCVVGANKIRIFTMAEKLKYKLFRILPKWIT